MKILIVAPAWVGDMVMAHTLVTVLSHNADAQIDMVAPPATAPLADRMPGVTKCFTLDAGHGELGLGKRRTLAALLAKEGYDQAIVLPNSFKSALLPFWARVPKRTGWHGEARFVLLNDRRRLEPERYPLMIERFMALALPAGAALPKPYPEPRLSADPDRGQALVRELGLATSGITVLCPGAEFGPAKRWPPGHYAAVARHEVARGRQVWLLGSKGDAQACAEIESLTPGGLVNLAGRTRLLDALDLLALADRVVCNDSGLMHVACALERPVVAIFGSTSPDFTPPLGQRARVLSHLVPCSPCFQRECPLGHLDCLVKLTPERVIEAL
ncbi:MAG: lipopolysaccharide heptosyltransferase II [Pseudomonadales bacterium]